MQYKATILFETSSMKSRILIDKKLSKKRRYKCYCLSGEKFIILSECSEQMWPSLLVLLYRLL